MTRVPYFHWINDFIRFTTEHCPDVVSGCWRLHYTDAFDLIADRLGAPRASPTGDFEVYLNSLRPFIYTYMGGSDD